MDSILKQLKSKFVSTPRKLFAGIGPREITEFQFERIIHMSYAITLTGYILRSGGARGCDNAFEIGNKKAFLDRREIFIPWNCFKQDHRDPNSKMYYEDRENVFVFNFELNKILEQLVREFHPKYNDLGYGPKKLMKRNCHQILGYNLDEPVEFIITDGKVSYDKENKIKDCAGGTGFAVRLGYALDIPIYNLSNEDHLNILLDRYGVNSEKREFI